MHTAREYLATTSFVCVCIGGGGGHLSVSIVQQNFSGSNHDGSFILPD